MWGHPHVIPSPIQSCFTSQLSFLCPYTHQHTDQDNSSLTTTANHSHTPSFSTSTNKENDPLQLGLHLMSCTYQLCQPANGRADWTAGDRNKRKPFWPMRFSSGPERYTEQGIEAPVQAISFPPRPYLQCGSPHPSLSPNVETRSNDLYP